MFEPQIATAAADHIATLKMSSADEAAWASAIGSFAAGLIALAIAISGGIAHRLSRRRDGQALAAYLCTEVDATYQYLGHAIDYLETFLKGDADFLMKLKLENFGRDTIAGLAGNLLEAKIDRFGVLPNGIGHQLASGVGSLRACRDAVNKFVAEVRSTRPPDWEGFCAPMLAQLNATKANFKAARKYCLKQTNKAA